MNTNLEKILFDLNATEYTDFLRNSLGMQAFLAGDGSFVTTAGVNRRNKSYYKGIGRMVNSNNEKTLIYLEEEDYEKRIFRDDKQNIYEASKYFDGVFEPVILEMILISVYGLKKFYHKIKKEDPQGELSELQLGSHYSGEAIFNKNPNRDFQFILGAGVNLDKKNLKISIGNWSQLIDSMRDAVRSIKGMPTPPAPPSFPTGTYNCKIKVCDELIDLEEAMCNTNYMGPEILKDLDEKRYYHELYNNLYSSFNPSTLNKANNPMIVDTNLFQIARIAAKRGRLNILTFNYDSVLEEIMGANFLGAPYQSLYLRHKSVDPAKKINIIHSHGFFPYNQPKAPKGIVLSTYEYLRGYYTATKYPRKMLIEQLKKTNILIGNSVSDYEEQKVFYANFKKTPSSWHFLFLKESDENHAWIDDYKACYFMRMGIIPVFFKDFPDITTYLKTL